MGLMAFRSFMLKNKWESFGIQLCAMIVVIGRNIMRIRCVTGSVHDVCSGSKDSHVRQVSAECQDGSSFRPFHNVHIQHLSCLLALTAMTHVLQEVLQGLRDHSKADCHHVNVCMFHLVKLFPSTKEFCSSAVVCSLQIACCLLWQDSL